MTDPSERIYQRLTPPGVGGIHVFALEAQDLDAFTEAHFIAKGRGQNDLNFGHLIDGDDLIDEVIIHRRPDRLDLSIHGGIAVEKRVAELLESCGFTKGEISEPTKRRNQAPALYEEADACLREAISPHAVLFFLAVLEGGLVREVTGWIETLAPGEAEHEARRVGVEAAIDSMLIRAEFGMSMSSPPRVVLAGPVNAGKSTLFNTLLGKERAIVADEAGTTRDLIEAPLELDGYPFALIDTAGLRETSHEIEGLGVLKARSAQRQASIVIYVQPAATFLTDEDVDTEWDQKAQLLMVGSKVDELTAAERGELNLRFPQVLPISCQEEVGFDELRRRIIFRSPFAGPAVREFPCPFTKRQVELLVEAQGVLPNDPGAAASLLKELLFG